jgi:hypothetical protein
MGKWHTTGHQWWCNLFKHFLVADCYNFVLSDFSGPFRLMLYPVNIWAVELVQDAALRWLHGFNPAWDYRGCAGARFNGAICLEMWPEWLLVGLVFECVYWPLFSSV